MNTQPELVEENNAVIMQAEEILGYGFRDKKLLLRALTHRSLSQDTPSYERLEFLGDRILGMVVAEMLYQEFPNANEGELSTRLANWVNKSFLSGWMLELNIGNYIRMSAECHGNGLKNNIAILADIAESIIAAIYLDGGMAEAKKFLACHIGKNLTCCPIQKDAKSRLQNWCQANMFILPEYQQMSQSGPPHAPWFVFSVSAGEGNAHGEGSSKREAMQAAATNYWYQYIESLAAGDNG